jgi:glycerol dehydrogenase-like iron-containing ADH family enzyme
MISTRIRAIAAAGLMVSAAGGAYAASDWLTGSTEEQLKTLAGIQPGLGTVMIEYSNRYTDTYYAAKGGNWELAAYMLKEALEIQEVAEATRPARAGALKAFETAYLEPLNADIEAKDFQKFDAGFKAGVKGCNGCHASQGYAFIEYVLPDAPPSPLLYTQ